MSPPTIKKIAIAGASGRVGKAAASALVAAGFEVTALVRPDSKTTSSIPKGVVHVETDFSQASLVQALRGHQALVSTLSANNDEQLLAPAIDAGVYRFIPSQFGCSTHLNPELNKLQTWSEKYAFEQKVVAAAKKNANFTWTTVDTGMFSEAIWALLLQRGTLNASVIDGGDHHFSFTSLDDIGKSIVEIMRHPEETANRPIVIHTGITSPNAVMAGYTALHPDKKFIVTDRTHEEVIAATDAEFAKEKPNFYIWALNQIWLASSSALYNGVFDKVDNELLGIKKLSDNEATDIVVSQFDYPFF